MGLGGDKIIILAVLAFYVIMAGLLITALVLAIRALLKYLHTD